MLQLVNPEELGTSINGRTPETLDETLSGYDRVFVQNAQKHVAPRHATSLLESPPGMVHELEGGDESHRVKRIVFIRKILREAPIQGDPRWEAGSGDVQHGGRRFETGDLVAETGEPLQEEPRAAPDLEDALRQDRRPHPEEDFLLDGCSRFAGFGREPILVSMSIFKAKDVPHRG